MATFELRSADDARSIDERFNGFHDGFISRLCVLSHDRFMVEENGAISHEVTGKFDVEIDIAHYNYGDGLQPADRVIQARFINAEQIELDLRNRSADTWPVIALEFVPRDDGRFDAAFMWHRLTNQEWSTETAIWYSFEWAVFEEIDRPVAS